MKQMIETVDLSTQNIYKNWCIGKHFLFPAPNICLSRSISVKGSSLLLYSYVYKVIKTSALYLI